MGHYRKKQKIEKYIQLTTLAEQWAEHKYGKLIEET
jgi:hypothetical protein